MTALEPHQVFVPRSYLVTGMYIARPKLETALSRAIVGSKHIIIHGESGSGKTWLYKKVFNDTKTFFHILNLASASRHGSITSLSKLELSKFATYHEREIAEEKGLDVGVNFLNGNLTHTRISEKLEEDPLLSLFREVRKSAGEANAMIVFDNFESILSQDSLLKELGDIVTLLDDEQYASQNVKLLIVGVPSGIREYFSVTANRPTVANRLEEMHEVIGLTQNDVHKFIERGFVSELGYNLSSQDIDRIAEHSWFITDGNPQRLHEYCLQLAYALIDHEGLLAEETFKKADAEWISSSLSSNYVAVLRSMNAAVTVTSRRNQVIYALGKMHRSTFRTSEIEETVKREFPTTTRDVQINISQNMSNLTNRNDPIIRATPHSTGSYQFTDPRYRMCIRVALTKSDDERVVPVEVGGIFHQDLLSTEE